MNRKIGIRREDKNRWERRVPLIPDDLKELADRHGIQAVVQPSGLRIFPDADYVRAGAVLSEDLKDADTVFAVKEIPVHLLEPEKTYIFFSHTIKGQPYNMDMLRRLMALKCNLVDYERIVDEQNRRLIFFGVHAGYAGMIETLHAYGRKMQMTGIDSPFLDLRQAYEYDCLEDAKAHIRRIGERISDQGLPLALCPLTIAFTGYGNVSGGAQEIFDLLPFREISPDQMEDLSKQADPDTRHLYKVVFKEADMVQSRTGAFDLQDYYASPEKYESVMDRYLPFMDILVNCIYWTDRYPRIVTRTWLRDQASAQNELKLKVIGDISCDIEGSVEITKEATLPDRACFTYEPRTDGFEDGIRSSGVTVMAIDNLPCEFSREASMFFSRVLKGFAPDLARADFSRPFDSLELPRPIKQALILHQGRLTQDYRYMEQFI